MSSERVVADATDSNTSSTRKHSAELDDRSCAPLRHIDIEEADKVVLLCTCQQSACLPLCDDTHEKFNRETHSNLQPLALRTSDLQKILQSQGHHTSLRELSIATRPTKPKKVKATGKRGKTSRQRPVDDTSPASEVVSVVDPSTKSADTASESDDDAPATAEAQRRGHDSRHRKQHCDRSSRRSIVDESDDDSGSNEDANNDAALQRHERHKLPLHDAGAPPKPRQASLLRRVLGPLPVITRDELARHNTLDDCWVAVHDYVYNVTDYLDKHPAGKACILKHAGTDVTYHEQFHSSRMMRILNRNYLLGRLERSAPCVLM